MTDKPNAKRTTVWLPEKLYTDFQRKHGKNQLSSFVRQMIEYDLMKEKPELIDREIEKIKTTSESKIKLLLTDRKIAEENQQKKAIRLGATDVEVWDYRTTTPPAPSPAPPAPSPAPPKASAKKGGDK